MLAAYSWPGNVRELFGVLERALAAATTEPTLYAKHLPPEMRINVKKASLERGRHSIAPGPGPARAKGLPGPGRNPAQLEDLQGTQGARVPGRPHRDHGPGPAGHAGDLGAVSVPPVRPAQEARHHHLGAAPVRPGRPGTPGAFRDDRTRLPAPSVVTLGTPGEIPVPVRNIGRFESGSEKPDRTPSLSNTRPCHGNASESLLFCHSPTSGTIRAQPGPQNINSPQLFAFYPHIVLAWILFISPGPAPSSGGYKHTLPGEIECSAQP